MQLRIFITWIEMSKIEYELVKSLVMVMGLMGLMSIGGICMVLYVMDAWIINLSDFHQECPSDKCPILHSHSIPCKILHIHTYTTPILILSMNLDRAKSNCHRRSHPSTVKFDAKCQFDQRIILRILRLEKEHSTHFSYTRGKEYKIEIMLRR